MGWFWSLNAPVQAGLAGLFTYLVTALGAGVVFFFRTMNQKTLDLMMGFAAGVMIAAAFWSLLSPAIELSIELGGNAWLTASVGFLCGGFFIIGSDIFLSGISQMDGEVHSPASAGKRKRLNRSSKRSLLLASAVTLHNIPEGLAIGVAFGCAALGVNGATAIAAAILALGIGLQNFPEGVCVSMPLCRDGASRLKSFIAGQASAAVEPPAAILGALGSLAMRSALPLILSFSAGAMIAVVCSELIPESFKNNKIVAALGVLFGFATMMVLDVALG